MSEKYHPPFAEIEMSDVLHALGDPTRLRIARMLYAAGKPLTCQQAAVPIEDLPVSTRSHCFHILRCGGVIRSEKAGRECYNSIRLAELEEKFPGLIPTILENKK